MEEVKSSTGGGKIECMNISMLRTLSCGTSSLIPYIPLKEVKDGELTITVVKTIKEYSEADKKKIEKNYKAKKNWCVVLTLMNTIKSLDMRLPKRFWIVFKQLMKSPRK